MTIKEIEDMSGMTRANIRYYEAEGLLTPKRHANKYRDYSDNDLEVLKKIKLLRSLHMSLEDIKALHTGKRELADMLDRHLNQLQQEQQDIEQSRKICKVMRKDGARYQTLDAQHYLDALARVPYSTDLGSDTLPEIRAPWRRYFARCMDLLLYTVIWEVFLSLVLHVNIMMRSTGDVFLDNVVTLLMMLVLEPVQLYLFGTTFGKAILGLHVTDHDERRLTYENARTRTWKMLLHGMGCTLPIYNIVRLWKSYRACSDGETLEWEYGSAITLKDERGWRIAAHIFTILLLAFLPLLAHETARQPVHRGDITIAQFSENYNRMAEFYDLESYWRLDKQGKWIPHNRQSNITILNDSPPPTYVFSENDGVMTGMRFSYSANGSDQWIHSFQNEIMLSVLAFARAQEGCGMFSTDTDEIISSISSSPFESFAFSAYGVQVVYEVNSSGYYDSQLSVFIPQDGAKTSFSLSFSMQRQ